jgi:hypothetical protein
MGLISNIVQETVIGGGIVEWVARVRNNEPITKIVVVGWRDMYGQEQQAQTQIGGGQIVSIRLDLTQSRFVAPVTNVHLVSCR